MGHGTMFRRCCPGAGWQVSAPHNSACDGCTTLIQPLKATDTQQSWLSTGLAAGCSCCSGDSRQTARPLLEGKQSVIVMDGSTTPVGASRQPSPATSSCNAAPPGPTSRLTRQQPGCSVEQVTFVGHRGPPEPCQRGLGAVLGVGAAVQSDGPPDLPAKLPPALADATEGHELQRPIAWGFIPHQAGVHKSNNLRRKRHSERQGLKREAFQ